MALSRTNAVATASNITSGSLPAFTTTVNVGDIIVACGVWRDTSLSYGFSDNVNSGAYTAIPNFPITYANSWICGIYYKVANASGTPTITPSAYGVNGVWAIGASYSGFPATPTIVANDQAFNSAASGTALSAGPFSASTSNQVAMCFESSNSSVTSDSMGAIFGTPRIVATGAQLRMWDSLGTTPGGITSGTSVSASGTLTGSSGWGVTIIGISPTVSVNSILAWING